MRRKYNFTGDNKRDADKANGAAAGIQPAGAVQAAGAVCGCNGDGDGGQLERALLLPSKKKGKEVLLIGARRFHAVLGWSETRDTGLLAERRQPASPVER